MNEFFSWARRNLLMPVLLSLASALISTIYMSTEINASDYRTLSELNHDGTPAFRDAISVALNNGSVSHWEFRSLEGLFVRERGYFAWQTSSRSLSDERKALTESVLSTK